ncbi:MAG: cupin domain-containing protein [Planctomycetota bacterium]|nr:cupin domain-containing protein [Planctomycetota bacterium]
MSQTPIHISPNPSDETIRLGPLVIRFLLTAEDSNGSVAAFELTVPGSQRLMATAHSHIRYEETIYALEGTMTWTVGGKPIDLAAGQALCIPRGAVHRFDNHGPQASKSLCVITPAALGPQYFREMAAVIDDAKPGPPDKARMVEIMLRHGLTPAGG